MIHHTIPTVQTLSWQDELSQLISTPEALFQALSLDPAMLDQARLAHALFPVRCTTSFLKRIKAGDLNDPLLKQILPLGIETEPSQGFNADPLQEADFNPEPGLVHKYRSRALLIASGQCAINCRYCFRRSFDYSANRLDKQALSGALRYIAEDNRIEEVILSGGDPALGGCSRNWKTSRICADCASIRACPSCCPSASRRAFAVFFRTPSCKR
jgi:KamA family protein